MEAVEPAGKSPESSPMQMPAPPEVAARDVARIGVEGRPADAKAGPRMLRMQMLFFALGLLVLSGGVALWLGWQLGLALLVLSMLALLLNPVFGATGMRADDREKAARLERWRGASSAGRSGGGQT